MAFSTTKFIIFLKPGLNKSQFDNDVRLAAEKMSLEVDREPRREERCDEKKNETTKKRGEEHDDGDDARRSFDSHHGGLTAFGVSHQRM